MGKTFEEIIKFNPYHDRLGRFTTGGNASFMTIRTKDPKKQHMADVAIARAKEQSNKETRRTFKPEKLEAEVITGAGSYKISGGEIVTPSGKKVYVTGNEKYKELPKESPMYKQAIKAGIAEPVVVDGRNIYPKSVIETAVKQTKQEKENRKWNMDNNVSGYEEIKQAQRYNAEQRRKFNEAFDSEDGVVPTPHSIDVAALAAKYPRASAYIHAESYSMASNHDKSVAGNKAMERIRRGEDHKTAITDMEREWSEAATRSSMWA